MRRWLGLSVAVHALLLAAYIMSFYRWPSPSLPPPDPATIEIVLGDGARESGPAASPETPPPVPPTAEPPAAPEPEAALIAPPAPPAEPVLPPTVPLPPPPPTPPAVAETQPEPAPPQPPAPDAPPPNVNVADGVAGPAAKLLDPGRIVRPAQADRSNLAPVYPVDSARRHEQGQVVLRLHIDADGRVGLVDIIESSGFPRLDEAAQTQLKIWKFKPAEREGTAVADTLEIGINFRLN